MSKECKLKDSINTGKGEYKDTEKEKIDHPHELTLVTTTEGTTFTCSNMTFHTINEWANYNCPNYYRCKKCEYKLCLKCYVKVYCPNYERHIDISKGAIAGVEFKTVDKGIFNPETDDFTKVTKLYSKFDKSNKGHYIIYKNIAFMMWYEFFNAMNYYKEMGDRPPYICYKCEHKYSSLIPRFINKYIDKDKELEEQKNYICAYCVNDFEIDVNKFKIEDILFPFTYCNINYTFEKGPENEANFKYYICNMCRVDYPDRYGKFLSISRKTSVCLQCATEIKKYYINLPLSLKISDGINGSWEISPGPTGELLKLGEDLEVNEQGQQIWYLRNPYKCYKCEDMYDTIFGRYLINNDTYMCPKCSLTIRFPEPETKTTTSQTPISQTVINKSPSTIQESVILQNKTYTPEVESKVNTSFRKKLHKRSLKKSRKRSLKKSRKRSVKRSRKRSVKRSRKRSVKRSRKRSLKKSRKRSRKRSVKRSRKRSLKTSRKRSVKRFRKHSVKRSRKRSVKRSRKLSLKKSRKRSC